MRTVLPLCAAGFVTAFGAHGVASGLGFLQSDLPALGLLLAKSTSEERPGQTMGSAEVGREPGDAGGPLLVGGLASLPVGLLGPAAVIALTAW